MQVETTSTCSVLSPGHESSPSLACFRSALKIHCLFERVMRKRGGLAVRTQNWYLVWDLCGTAALACVCPMVPTLPLECGVASLEPVELLHFGAGP